MSPRAPASDSCIRRPVRFAAAWALVAVLGLGLAAATARGQDTAPVAFEDSSVAFRFSDQRITESSGLAQSLRDPHRIWTHNDSGDSPRIYAVDNRDGDTIAAMTLEGTTARDWEAMTTCQEDDDEVPVIWVGDIGDNLDAWKTYRLMKVDEPLDPRDGEIDAATYPVRYGDGKARDAEALLCHPRTGRLYLVSKESEGAVYEGPSRMRRGETNEFDKIADAPSTVTDGVFLPDGKHAVLRGYQQAWVLDTENDWTVIASFFPPLQIQGETVAVAADGKALLFGSEGVNSQVHRVELPQDLSALQGTGENPADTQATPTAQDTSADRPGETPRAEATTIAAEGQSSESASDSEGIPGIDGPWVALLSVLALLAVVLALVSRRD